MHLYVCVRAYVVSSDVIDAVRPSDVLGRSDSAKREENRSGRRGSVLMPPSLTETLLVCLRAQLLSFDAIYFSFFSHNHTNDNLILIIIVIMEMLAS